MNKLFILLLAVATIAVSSCGGNDDDGGNTNENCVVNYSNDLSEAGDDIVAALNVFTSDPSDENCQAYLQTLRDYLDVIESYENCAGLNQGEFQMQLAEARQSVEDTTCN
ncbi:MAG: hypothetical protein AAFY36_02130 [Bacteroidota bacterium]